MRYSVKGSTIRTENAAKPIGFASAAVLAWINSLPRHYVVLDYGCGKLRHAVPLAASVRLVVAVDSQEQVDRVQRVGGLSITVREYGSHMPNIAVYSVEQQAWRRRRYDAALCANVLSAIPKRTDRVAALRSIGRVLKGRSGRLLVTTQYRNSHYSAYKDHPGAEWFGDGWLVRSRGRVSFYALLDVTDVAALCADADLQVVEAHHVGESALVTCRRPMARR